MQITWKSLGKRTIKLFRRYPSSCVMCDFGIYEYGPYGFAEWGQVCTDCNHVKDTYEEANNETIPYQITQTPRSL